MSRNRRHGRGSASANPEPSYRARIYQREDLTSTLGVNFGRSLGKGNQGTIYSNGNKHKEPVVVKVVENPEAFKAELGCLDGVPSHPGIVGLRGYCIDGGFNAVVLENPNLKDKLLSLGWKETIVVMKQIAEGLDHLHAYNYIHSDVKPDNIVFVDDKLVRAKLVDFGASFKASYTAKARVKMTTMGYKAPNITEGVHTVGPEFDCFSFGVVCLQLLMRKISAGGNDFPTLTNRRDITETTNISAEAKFMESKGKPVIHEELSRSQDYDEEDGKDILKIVFRCVHETIQSRPKMKDVVPTLDRILAKINKPKD